MAKTNSLSVLLDPSGQMLLSELFAGVIENIQKSTVSGRIKNTDLSGDPNAGSVEAKRFKNANSKSYGTARSGGSGDKIKGKPVTINIDTDREFVEEIEEKDVSLLGVPGLLAKRAANHQARLAAELDQTFFAVAISEGTGKVLTGSTIAAKIEEMILALETTKNDYIDGIPRDMISVTCSPAIYSEMRNLLDTIEKSNVTTDIEEFNKFHGCRIWSSNRLPSNVDFIVMVDGSVAQPVMANPYSAEKIPLSEAYAVSLFFHYGTKCVMDDLILYYATAAGVTVSSAAGTTTGKTALTVDPVSAGTGRSFVYKTAATVTMPKVGENLTSWTAWNGTDEITATTGNQIVVAIVDSTSRLCKMAGSATVAAKA